MKDLYKTHIDYDKDHEGQKFIKKSKKSLSLDSSSNEIGIMSSSKANKDHEKDSENQKPTKLKKSFTKDNTIDFEEFMIDKETERATKRYLAEMKKLGITEAPTYFSMYDKVKARSSQNQSLKGQSSANNSGSSINRNKSDSDCFKTKSERGSDGSDSNSDSSDNENRRLIKNVKSQNFHIDKNEPKDSQSSDDEILFQPVSRNKSNKLNFNHRKRKVNCIQSSQSSSNESSSTSSDSEKEHKNSYKESSDLKTKKKLRKHQFNKNTAALNWNTDSDEDEIIKPIKNKNLINSSSSFSKKSKNNQALNSNQDKKDKDLLKDSKEGETSNNKKRSLNDDSFTSTKTTKDERSKKKKLQKNTSNDISDFNSNKNLEKDKENDLKSIKEEKSKSLNSKNDSIDSDDLSVNLHSSKNVLKKKKKKKDKISKQKDFISSKCKESLAKEVTEQLSPKICKQLKEDLELSDTSSDTLSNFKYNNKNSKDSKSMKKEEFYFDQSCNKKQKDKINKIEETSKDKKIISKENKKSFSSSDSDFENLYNIKESKHVKKQKKEKIREKSRNKEKEVDLEKSHDIDKDNEKDKIKEFSKDKIKEKERDKNKEKLKERDKMKEKTREKTKNKSKSKDKIKDNDTENNLENHKNKIKTEKNKDEHMNEKSDLGNEKRIKIEKDLEEKTDPECKTLISAHSEKDIHKDIENKTKNKLKKAKNKSKHKNKNKYDSDNDVETENELKSFGKNKSRSEKENESELRIETSKENDKKTETKADCGYEKLTKKDIKSAKELEAKIKKQSFSDNNLFSSKEQHCAGNEKDLQNKNKKDTFTDFCNKNDKLDKEFKSSHNIDNEKIKLKDIDKMSSDFDTNFKEKTQEKSIIEEKTEIKATKNKIESKNDHKDKNLGSGLPAVSHKSTSKKKESNSEKDNKHKEFTKSKSKESKASNKTEDFVLSKENFSKTKTIHSDNNTYLNDSVKNDVVDLNKNSSIKCTSDHKNNIYSDSDIPKDSKYSKTNNSSNKNNTAKLFEKIQRNDNENLDNANDLWVNEETPKCDIWSDITKSEESFTQYLNKGSISSTDEWGESDDEILSKYPLLSPLSNISTKNLSPLPVNHHQSSSSQLIVSKDVLKTIKSPKNQETSSVYPNESTSHNISKLKKKELKNKEDKCKENNEDRKKKIKKPKEHRDQKIKEEKKFSLNTEIYEKNIEKSSNLAVNEIKPEPIIAAAATIQSQIFFNSTETKTKTEKPNLMQPVSPFAEKHVQQLNTYPCKQNQRLLSEGNIIMNSSKKELKDFDSAKINEILSEKRVLSPVKNNSDKDETNNNKILLKNNEMMFSISEESSNDEFLPAIGISFSSNSSNSSINLINTNNNASFSNIASLSKKDEKSLLEKNQSVRKYEEEAAIETKRLEAELSKSKDSDSNWKSFKDSNKEFFLDSITNERLNSSNNSSTSLVNLNTSINKVISKKPNKSILLEDATAIFNVITSGEVKDPFLDSDEIHFKVTDCKDELDDQRKIEDDLAVSALLELEMNNDEVLSSQENVESPEISKTAKTSSSSTISKEKAESLSKDLNPPDNNEIIADEETNRLQIAEDLLNENSVDSDVFHSAPDDLPDTENTLKNNKNPSEILCTEQEKLSTAKLSTSNSIVKNDSKSILPSKLNSSDLKPKVCSRSEINKHELIKESAIDKGTDSALTEEENLEKSLKNFKTSSLINELVKKGLKNKEEIYLASKTEASFLHSRISINKKEIELPTSLAEVKQAIASTSNNKEETNLSTNKEDQLVKLEKQITTNLSSPPVSDILTNQLDVNNKLDEGSLTEESKVITNNVVKPNNVTVEQQRPKRGRKAKARKSSESEESFKLNPLSPNSLNLSSPLISPTSTQSLPVISLQNTTTSSTASNKINERLRRSTRGLLANSESTNNVADEHQNESPLEELTSNNAEEDIVMSTDGKRKRGRKKKFENLTNNSSIKIADSKISHTSNTSSLLVETNLETSKNLSPYDVFEFNDSEEETSPTLPLMTLHGNTTKSNEQNKNNLSTNVSSLLLSANSQENQKCDSNDLSSSIINDVLAEQSKSVVSAGQINLPTNNQDSSQQNSDLSNIEINQNSCDKEYTTELSQHGKISITIRLQQKDKEQANFENVSDLVNEEKSSEDNNSNDLFNSVQKPLTRKSARLMSQINKTTIDEVIEDVVKGIFDENIDSRNFDSEILELEEDAFLNDYFEKSNEFNTEEDSKTNKDSKNSRVTRSSVAKNINNLDESLSEDTIIELDEKNISPNVSKNHFSALSTTLSNSETKCELDVKAENIINNNINQSKAETIILTPLNQHVNSSKVLNTVIPNNDISMSSTNDSELQNKRTVLKVELPTVPFNNKITNEKECINEKPFEEIKKEETQISVNKVNLPIIAKSSPCTNLNANNFCGDSSKFLGSQGPKITTEGISVMKVIVPEKDTKTSLSNIIQTIPNISERIHNSTTALKLKTGKGLNLEESPQIQSINLTRNQNLTNNSEINTNSIVKNSSVDPIMKNSNNISQLDHLVPNPAISIDFSKNSFVSTSVISTINNPVVQSSNSVRPICSKNLIKQATNLVVSQPSILPSSSIIAPISSINTDQNDETTELQLQHQLKIKNAKPPQLLLPTSHFAAQIPNQELNLLHQQMLLMQQHPQQQFLSNAYAAAAAALHPELRMPINHLSPRFTFSPLNPTPNNILEKELDENKQLHQVKPQLQSQTNKVKSKQLADHQEKVIQDLGNLENMHPPSLLNSLRLPVNVSHPSNSMNSNFPSIRGSLPAHLLSPHESNQQQRFTESPAIIHGNVNSFARTPLLSPSLKEMKPQLIPQAHSNPNKTFEVPQRPHSSFSVSTINSPSPGFQNNLLPSNSSIGSASQLSPSLNYRKDLPSPMNVMDIPEQIHLPRKLHKAYAVSQQQSKDAANMMLNNILPYHQLPLPAHQSNPVNIHLPSNSQHALIPNAGLSYQQQVSNIALQQINSQINNPIEFSQPQPSGGDSVLIQKYPKLWQGLLALKNDQAAVQMHFVTGNSIIAQNALPPILADGTGAVPLRIAQRMRLEQTQLDGVCRKMQQVDEHCILLALPCGRDHMDVISQSNNLRTGFIQYLQSKQAAGIINTNTPGTNQPAYVVHIFPSCDFSNENLARIAPDLLVSIAEIAHLLVVIATV
ncbi:hypothetical protein RND71_043315 [Anisodus tanguticus]|uniref:SPOC domain-containing protein n=1 Tax=Anisodus tanguticus TaxID=243964 RepID=A0AAE1QPX6_9SOLA|nr:hypothetical protein RND71_043315 [Anisodus tanguticus]